MPTYTNDIFLKTFPGVMKHHISVSNSATSWCRQGRLVFLHLPPQKKILTNADLQNALSVVVTTDLEL